MGDVNDQPPHQHPDRHGVVSTRLAANSIPPRAGPPGWRLWAANLAALELPVDPLLVPPLELEPPRGCAVAPVLVPPSSPRA